MPDAQWADPDSAEAAQWLSRLRDAPELRRQLGARARAAASEKLSLAAYRRAIGESLGEPR